MKATVVGVATVAEIVAYAEANLKDWHTNTRLLWNLQGREFSAIAINEITNLSSNFEKVNEARSGCYTAILVDTSEAMLGELTVAFSVAHDVPVKHKLFTERDEAVQWLLWQVRNNPLSET